MTASDERIVIVGSGPAGAAAALASIAAGAHDVLVLDLGGELGAEQRRAADRMGAQPPELWRPDDQALITQQPVVTKDGLPQKRSFGSDFPFRDLGQLGGLAFEAGTNTSPVSSAYGGFSNVWGAQLMPFSASTFDTWPVSWERIKPHYASVLDEVPLAGESDDLLDLFPLFTDRARPLPPLAARTRRVLERQDRHRSRLQDAGVVLGRARLALHAEQCVSCGLCMTGCPYRLIYSASHTFDRLRRAGRIRYESGVVVTRVGEIGDDCVVTTTDLVTGAERAVRADRVFIGCGGIGSTRLALGSLPGAPDEVTLGESVQFAVPFVSSRPAGDPRHESTFTLNQFNILVDFGGGYHTSQVHCYPFNPSVLTALPGPLQAPALGPVTAQILARLTIGLGYLPSWASPAVRLRVTARHEDRLADVTIGPADDGPEPLMLKRVMRRLKRVAPLLDLYPVESALRLAAPAKSYHFGGGLPHRAPASRAFGTDDLGRPAPWQRIHLIDGAVLPSVPSTTFTFTVMANAHRIASEALEAAP